MGLHQASASIARCPARTGRQIGSPAVRAGSANANGRDGSSQCPASCAAKLIGSRTAHVGRALVGEQSLAANPASDAGPLSIGVASVHNAFHFDARLHAYTAGRSNAIRQANALAASGGACARSESRTQKNLAVGNTPLSCHLVFAPATVGAPSCTWRNTQGKTICIEIGLLSVAHTGCWQLPSGAAISLARWHARAAGRPNARSRPPTTTTRSRFVSVGFVAHAIRNGIARSLRAAPKQASAPFRYGIAAGRC